VSATMSNQTVSDVQLVNSDGSSVVYERRVTRCDDWRDVPGLGSVIFGYVTMGPLVSRRGTARPTVAATLHHI
jgi:hypothetical protein